MTGYGNTGLTAFFEKLRLFRTWGVLGASTNFPPMKTTLLSLLVATLLGFAFGSSVFVSLVFAAGLIAWTIEQYCRGPRSLMLGRRIHLPIKSVVNLHGAAADRQVA
jgi:hypothetical protein